MNSDIAIKIENVSKVFPLRQPKVNDNGIMVHEHWVLKDISFEIKKGESVGIIGPNGSGKSTLLKILAGVTKPTSGAVTIRGKVASILDIGAGFHPELSGRENVFLNGQIHGFSKKEIEAKFEEIIAFSGIENFIDEPVKNYSNGMYLRLAFSIMANLDFDVYLLDEVLSVGDEDFRYYSGSWMKNSNKTFIIISHNHKELFSISSRILRFVGGKLHFVEKEINHLSEPVKNIRNVYLTLKNQSKEQSIFHYTDEIEVELVVMDPKIECKDLVVGIVVKTINNLFVFESFLQIQKIPLQCKTIIPSKFFNNFQFKIDVVFVKYGKITQYIEELASFEVVNAQNFVKMDSWGVVMPDLIWSQD